MNAFAFLHFSGKLKLLKGQYQKAEEATVNKLLWEPPNIRHTRKGSVNKHRGFPACVTSPQRGLGFLNSFLLNEDPPTRSDIASHHKVGALSLDLFK